MTRPEIKSGYVLEVRNDDEEPELVMVTYNHRDILCFSNGQNYGDVENVDNFGRKLLKIYGRTTNSDTSTIDTYSRELLWQCKAKEMTLEEVIAELGYDIKIVNGGSR